MPYTDSTHIITAVNLWLVMPLLSILGPKQGIPPLAAARMQRCALLLSAYTYKIVFHSTQKHGNTDTLLKLPLLDSTPEGNPHDAAIFNLKQHLPVSAKEIAAETRSDKTQKTVKTSPPGLAQQYSRSIGEREKALALCYYKHTLQMARGLLMCTTTTSKTITALHSLFAQYGLTYQ